MHYYLADAKDTAASLPIKKLKAKQKYYVRIRAYAAADGEIKNKNFIIATK